MKGFHKMDEMELHISLRAVRCSWFCTQLALFAWGTWGFVRTGGPTLPFFLLVLQSLTYLLAQWAGRARVEERGVRTGLLLYGGLTTVFLVVFGALLWAVG